MPQHDLIVDNASGAAVRADINGALAALGSAMKGPNAPPVPIAGMVWVDDDTPSATIWTVKRYDGAEWIEEGRIDITANIYIPSEGVIAWADVASAATVDLGAQASRSLRLTGTSTINSFGTAGSGVRKRLRIATGLTITHNATSLICPGAANLVLGAGDIADVESLGSGNWLVVAVQRAPAFNTYLRIGPPQVISSGVAAVDFVLPASFSSFIIQFDNVRLANDGAALLLRASIDGGSSFLAGTSYAWAATYNNNTATAVGISQAAQAQGQVSGAADNGVSDVTIDGSYRFTVGSATRRAVFNGDSSFYDNSLTTLVRWNGTVWCTGGAAVNAIRLLASTGNISSGTFTLMGLPQ
jgi:hypothetical protein